jgi:hypothetical protein
MGCANNRLDRRAVLIDGQQWIAASIQAQWVAFARDGAPTDDAVWRLYGEDERILVMGDDFYQGQIEDDPIVPLLHRLRTPQQASPKGLLSLFRRLWPA